MKRVLAVITLERGTATDAAAELAAAARTFGPVERVVAVIPGQDLSTAGEAIAGRYDEVILLEDPRLENPDGDLYADALATVIEAEAPELVLIAHTNLAMDLAPRLAVLTDRPLLTDCLTIESNEDRIVGVRTMYAGKVHEVVEADMRPRGCIATIRPGAYDAAAAPSSPGASIRQATLPQELEVRRRYVETVEPETADVDISQAEVLVAVGRGIEDGDNMEIIEELAAALGAEVACSRPVVDSGWLPKSRQVGTSGVTVRPRIYVTVGISGSFQHMGGVKGSPYLVAINSDARAPIFGEADVGVVGDLFDVVPLLTEKIKASKA